MSIYIYSSLHLSYRASLFALFDTRKRAKTCIDIVSSPCSLCTIVEHGPTASAQCRINIIQLTKMVQPETGCVLLNGCRRIKLLLKYPYTLPAGRQYATCCHYSAGRSNLYHVLKLRPLVVVHKHTHYIQCTQTAPVLGCNERMMNESFKNSINNTILRRK